MINKEASNSFIFFGFIFLILQVMSFFMSFTDAQISSIFDLMIRCAYLLIASVLFYFGWKYRQ